MKKFKGVVSWLIPNGLFALLIYFAMFVGSVGAMNMLCFFVPLLTIISLFALHNDVVVALAKNTTSRGVPKIIDRLYDISIICTFAWFGALWFAGMYTIHYYLHEYLWDEIEKIHNKPVPTEPTEADKLRGMFSGGIKKVGEE